MIQIPALPIAAETQADLLVGALDMRGRNCAAFQTCCLPHLGAGASVL